MLTHLSPLLLVLSLALGWLAGCGLRALADWLPVRMEAEWALQARETLGQQIEEQTLPKLAWTGGTGWLQLSSAILTAGVSARYGITGAGLAACLLVWALLVLAAIDLATTYLPDALTLPLIWLGLLVNLDGLFTPLPDAVLGAALGYLALWLLYWGFKLVTGQEGMGFGDFKLMAALGAWFGWAALPDLALVAALSAIVATLGHHTVLRWRDPEATLGAFPFGPYLALAGLLGLFCWPRLPGFLH